LIMRYIVEQCLGNDIPWKGYRVDTTSGPDDDPKIIRKTLPILRDLQYWRIVNLAHCHNPELAYSDEDSWQCSPEGEVFRGNTGIQYLPTLAQLCEFMNGIKKDMVEPKFKRRKIEADGMLAVFAANMIQSKRFYDEHPDYDQLHWTSSPAIFDAWTGKAYTVPQCVPLLNSMATGGVVYAKKGCLLWWKIILYHTTVSLATPQDICDEINNSLKAVII